MVLQTFGKNSIQKILTCWYFYEKSYLARMPVLSELSEPIFPAENLPYPLDEHAIAAIQKIVSIEKSIPGAIIILNVKNGSVVHMSE